MRLDLNLYLGLVTFSTAACGTGAASTGLAVYDSAGVQIVHNTEVDWTANVDWHLSDGAIVDIGVVDGAAEYQLFRPSSAFVLSDGRILVANNGTHELRYYADTGRYLRSSGGQGGGPGEFQVMSHVTRTTGDTIMVFDRRASRVSFFDETGEFVNSFIMRSDQRFFAPEFLGRFSSGALLAGYTPRPTSVEATLAQPLGITRGTTLAVVFDDTGHAEDTLGTFVGPWTDVVMAPTDGGGIVPSPTRFLFTPATSFQLKTDTLYAGSGDSFEIRVFNDRGDLQRIIRSDRDPTPVTPQHVTRLIEQLRESLTRAGLTPRRVENQIERTKVRPPAEAFPAFGLRHWLVDPGGNLWVARYDKSMEVPGAQINLAMDIFDATGRFQGVMRLPDGFNPTDIGNSYIVGIWQDELDVPHIRLYELTKSG